MIKTPTLEADRESEGIFTGLRVGTFPEGAWYFHLRFVDAYGNWSPTRHVLVGVDTSPPSAGDDADELWHQSFTVHLGGTDTVSGVGYVAYSVDGAVEQTLPADRAAVVLRTWKRGANSGVHTVAYRVIDQAGNETNGSCEVHLDRMPPATVDDAPRDASGQPVPQTSEAHREPRAGRPGGPLGYCDDVLEPRLERLAARDLRPCDHGRDSLDQLLLRG